MSKRRWLNGLIGLLLALSACGSPPPASAPPPTSTPAPPTTPTSAATIAPPTAVPPTATTPPTATAAPTTTPAPTVDPLHTACDHPYWPLRSGAVWHVNAQTKVYTETVTTVTGDLTKAEATLVDTYTNGTTQKVLIECDPDGLSYGNALFTYADGHASTKNVVSSSGHFLLAAGQLVTGTRWSWSVTADYSVPNYDKQGVFTQQSAYRNVSSQNCALTKVDTITLTVGTFQALRVDCQGADVSTSNGTTATYPFNAQLAYALGVGPNGAAIQSYSVP